MISYLASSKRYIASKIHKDLLEKEYQISEKRVQKLMTELDIRSIVRKKYRPASLSKQEAKKTPNLLKCDFSTSGNYCLETFQIDGDTTRYRNTTRCLKYKNCRRWAYPSLRQRESIYK